MKSIPEKQSLHNTNMNIPALDAVNSLLPVARRLHGMGANIVIQNDDKKPIHKYAFWFEQNRRQTAAEFAALPWKQAARISIMLGPGVSDNWIALDLDHQPDIQARDQWLIALGLPLDYAWAERSKSGTGWHIIIRCPGLELDGGAKKYDREAINGGHTELRAHGVLITLNTLADHLPDDLPALVDPALITAVYHKMTVTPEPKPAPVQPDYKPGDLPSDASEREEVLSRINAEIAHRLIKRGNKPGVYCCPLEHGPDGKDFLFDPATGRIGGCQGKHAGQLTRIMDLAHEMGIDTAKIARDVWTERHAKGYVYQAIENEPAPAPVIVEFFEGEQLNYYPDGIPLTVIDLLNPLHINQWCHLERGDIKGNRAWVTLWAAWHDGIISGRFDPHAPVSVADLVDRTGLSSALIRNALTFGDLFQFITLYREQNNIGIKTEINRGRPSDRWIFNPLDVAWRGFMNQIEPLLWRALVVEKYPSLPVEALDLDDLLSRWGITLDDIGRIDDICQPLYEQHWTEYQGALKHLAWRINEWRAVISAGGDGLNLPEGATYSTAAQFGDLLNQMDHDQHGGERVGTERYEAARRSGRTAASHKKSCNRLGIASVPEYKAYTVLSDAPLINQCENIGQDNYFRGRIKIHAPNGEVVTASPGYARSFDYDAWLSENGGATGATIQVWEKTIEKAESALSEKQQADRDEISRRQRAISAQRQQAEPAPSKVDQWLTQQGEMRADLFDVQPDQLEGNVWIAIKQQLTGQVVAKPIESEAMYTADESEIDDLPMTADPEPPAATVNTSFTVDRPVLVTGTKTARIRPCAYCGAPGDNVSLVGVYCDAHITLPLAEKLKVKIVPMSFEFAPVFAAAGD